MKAAVHTRYGPPDVVRITDVDKPAVTDHEVLVKVHATTVNRTDCGFRAARPSCCQPSVGIANPRADRSFCAGAAVPFSFPPGTAA